MIIPAERVYYLLLLVGVIGFVLAIFANLTVGLFAIIILNLVILGLMILDGGRVRKKRVIVNRDRLPKLSVGRENLVTLSLKSQNQSSQIILKDDYPSIFWVSSSTLEMTLSPHTVEEVNYTIFPDQRGEFVWGDIHLRQLGMWQLAWYAWKVPGKQKVAVYPDLIGLRSLSVQLALNQVGTIHSRRALNQGTEFRELREYVSGEDPRLIDWKATARFNSPMIRVLETEREQTLIILLDRGRLMTAQVQGLKRFDWGLNSTLSLALAGLNRGDRVGIGVFDREMVTWMPPERGQTQLFKMIERLTPLQPQLLESDYFRAVTQSVTRENRRALVVLITDLIDATASAELLSAMKRLTPRYLPFCVALRDPQVDEIAHQQTETLKALYQRGVGLDLLAQRQAALSQLQQKGVLVLDAPVNQVSEQLVNRYLQIKARNLL